MRFLKVVAVVIIWFVEESFRFLYFCFIWQIDDVRNDEWKILLLFQWFITIGKKREQAKSTKTKRGDTRDKERQNEKNWQYFFLWKKKTVVYLKWRIETLMLNGTHESDQRRVMQFVGRTRTWALSWGFCILVIVYTRHCNYSME